MSATLADDSVLVTHFDVDVEAARTPLTPQLATDVGDRLVLTPQELDPDLTDEDLRQLTHEISQLHNTVVLVPSFARADLWRSQAPLVLSAENIAEGVARLRREHVGLVVIVNKYDGIDLPDDACRLLVLDGVPEVRRGIDRIEESALYGTPEQLAQAMQRVEQGMGRGVRSTDDRCAVMLMGRSLVRHLYSAGAMAYLTPATRAQVELSRRIGEQIRSGGLSELRQALAVVLDRDSKWIALSRAATVQVRYNATGTVSESAESLRRSFNQVLAEDIHGAIATVQEHVNAATEQRSLGWHKQYLAELTNFVDQVAAQVIQKAARADNIVALKPLAGIEYVTMRTAGSDQAQSAATFMRTRYANGNELAVDVYGHLEALQFYAGTAEPFEAAFAWLAELLGFASQRPEKEYGHGPDVLWSLGGLSYFVIEAKNGVTTGIISKDHANQLAGSIHWFRQRYDSSCTVTPVLAHPSTRLGPAATTPPDTRVIDIAGLRQLKDEVRHVVTAIGNGSWPPQPDTLRQLLMRHHLHAGTLLQRFSSVPRAR